MQDSLIAQLRRATRDRHAEVEALLAFDAPFDLASYGRALAGFDAFLRAWEPAMARALPADLRAWFAPRCRGAMARRDLRALGMARFRASGGVDVEIDGLSQALGSLYVLEGSALGGQVIAREAARRHGLHASNGAAYFNGWGERTGAMWREFQQMLERHDANGIEREQAFDSAVRTFDALTATFKQVGHAASATA